nr:hypothetical protein [Candidatus Njordarchaeota archaeon]
MKKEVVTLLVVVALGTAIISAVLVMPPLPVDTVKSFEWTNVCHSAVVDIYLTTDGRWVTNNSYKITFLFTVRNISSYPNATTYYDNSYIILNSIKLDPSYINASAAPFKKLSERQGWSVDWYFTPKANDFTLSCMGISKGEHLQYPLFLEVDYTVVDSEGVEWPGLFQTVPGLPSNDCATITIVGGEDAP